MCNFSQPYDGQARSVTRILHRADTFYKKNAPPRTFDASSSQYGDDLTLFFPKLKKNIAD
jgi:cytolysin (calcineurin-like family phosphatase)